MAAAPVRAGSLRSVTAGPVTFEYCDYVFDPGNSPGVSIGVADLGNNGPGLFARFRASKESDTGYRPVASIGDEAFFAGQNLHVRQGGVGLILYVGRSTGDPRGVRALPDERQLAALVLGRR